VDPIERTPTEPADYAALSKLVVHEKVETVLAATAGNDLLQAAFQYLCAHATTQQRVAEDPSLTSRVQRVA